MRNKLLFGLLALLSVAVLFSFTDERVIAPTTYKTVFTGTITNTEIDTIELSTMVNNYRLSVQKKVSQTSGTSNVMFIRDVSDAMTGTTNWVTLDTLTGTSTTAMVKDYGEFPYLRCRYRAKGTGTQVSTYSLWVVAKPKPL